MGPKHLPHIITGPGRYLTLQVRLRMSFPYTCARPYKARIVLLQTQALPLSAAAKQNIPQTFFRTVQTTFFRGTAHGYTGQV